MEQKLRSASSVDELMSLIYPSYWAALKCRSKLSAAASSASKFTQRPQTHRLRPLSEAEEPTYAAAYLNLDVLKSKCLLFSPFTTTCKKNPFPMGVVHNEDFCHAQCYVVFKNICYRTKVSHLGTMPVSRYLPLAGSQL